MLRAPKDYVKHEGNEVQALLGQRVEVLAPVVGTGRPREDSLLLKKGKAGSKDIGRDSLFRFQELAIRFLASKNDVANCCCPLIPLAVSIDDANGKIAVRLVQKGIEAKLPRWTMLRFRNEQAARCPLILLARWPRPLISLMRLSPMLPIIRSNPK